MRARQVLPVLGLAAAATLFLAFASPAQKPGEKPADTSGAARAAGAYEVDGVHSSVLFRAKHFGVSYFYGAFSKVSGSFTADAAKPENSKVSVEIDTDSVDSRNSGRDGHLKSPSFLDVKQFPSATFVSKSVKKKGERTFTVAGDFTLHGVTKPVTLEMEEVGAAKTPKGARAGFHGILTIQRSDYGITFMADALSDEVQITISLEGVQAGSGEGK
jgi:polyisoprenoid-binding protein YceI